MDNLDILWLIAQYVEPNPVVYSSLGLVSRKFHHVFTSDQIWRPLDPYGKNSQIFRHFIETINESKAAENLLRLFWSGVPQAWLPESLQELTDNKYIWLGYLLNSLAGGRFAGFEKDKTLVRAAISLDPMSWLFGTWEMKHDHSLMMACLKKKPVMVKVIPEDFFTDENIRELLLSAPEAAAHILNRFPARRDQQEWLQYAVRAPSSLGFFSPRILDTLSRAEVLQGVAANPQMLKSVAECYRNDDEVVLAAARSSAETFDITTVSQRFRSIKQVVKYAVKCFPWAYMAISPDLQADPQVVEAVLTAFTENHDKDSSWNYAEVFSGLHVPLTESVAKAILSVEGSALEFMPQYQDNEELALAAAYNDHNACKFVSPRLLRAATLQAITGAHWQFQLDIEIDQQVVDLLLTTDWDLRCVPSQFKTRDFVKQRPQLQTLGDRLPEYSNDTEIVHLAVRKYGHLQLMFANERFKKDTKTWKLALEHVAGQSNARQSPTETEWVLRELPHEFYTVDFLRPFISKFGTTIPSILEKEELALLSVIANERTYPHIPDRLAANLEFNFKAVSGNGGVFAYLHQDMLDRVDIQERIGKIVNHRNRG